MTSEQFDRFANKLDLVTQTLATVVARLDVLTAQFAAHANHGDRLTAIETRMAEEEKAAARARRVLGSVVGVGATLLAGIVAVAASHIAWR